MLAASAGLTAAGGASAGAGVSDSMAASDGRRDEGLGLVALGRARPRIGTTAVRFDGVDRCGRARESVGLHRAVAFGRPWTGTATVARVTDNAAGVAVTVNTNATHDPVAPTPEADRGRCGTG